MKASNARLKYPASAQIVTDPFIELVWEMASWVGVGLEFLSWELKLPHVVNFVVLFRRVMLRNFKTFH